MRDNVKKQHVLNSEARDALNVRFKGVNFKNTDFRGSSYTELVQRLTKSIITCYPGESVEEVRELVVKILSETGYKMSLPLDKWKDAVNYLISIANSIKNLNSELKVELTKQTEVSTSFERFSHIKLAKLGTITLTKSSPKQESCSVNIVMVPPGTLLYHGWHTTYKNTFINTKPTWFSFDKDMAKNHVLVFMSEAMHLNDKKSYKNIVKLNPKLLAYQTTKMVPIIWFNNDDDYRCFGKMIGSPYLSPKTVEDKYMADKLCKIPHKIGGWVFLEDEGQIMLCRPKEYVSPIDDLHEMIRPRLWAHFVKLMFKQVRRHGGSWEDAYDDIVFSNWKLKFDIKKDGILHAYKDPNMSLEQQQMADEAWTPIKNPSKLPMRPEEELGFIFPNLRVRLYDLVDNVKKQYVLNSEAKDALNVRFRGVNFKNTDFRGSSYTEIVQRLIKSIITRYPGESVEEVRELVMEILSETGYKMSLPEEVQNELSKQYGHIVFFTHSDFEGASLKAIVSHLYEKLRPRLDRNEAKKIRSELEATIKKLYKGIRYFDPEVS